MAKTEKDGRDKEKRAFTLIELPVVRKRRSYGFTLIELLVVIAIIGILAGMLMAGLAAARRYARKVKAVVEVKGLETAFKQYYTEYLAWPTNLMTGDPEVDAQEISDKIALMLQGSNIVEFGQNSNPKKYQFMQFSRFNPAGDPIDPWGTNYYAKFDMDYDNVITHGSDAIRRPVIVWTSNEHYGVIGSWKQ